MAAGTTGRRYTPAQMHGLFDKARSHGWSLVRLARESGISLPTLSRWRKRLERGEEGARFVELVAAPSAATPGAEGFTAAPGLELLLRDGARILVREGASERLLACAIAALARPC